MSFILPLNVQRLCAALVLGASVSSAVSASALKDSRFTGFATLGAVSSDSSELVYRRNVSQDEGSHDGAIDWRTDSLVGVQWYGKWSSKIDTTVQVVARDRYGDSLENAVEWAFVRYRASDTVDVRLGRLGADIFLMSDYRRVGYAYPWVRPPQDFYGFLSLDHIDGLDISKQFNTSRGSVNVKAFYGKFDESWIGGSKDNGGIDFDLNVYGVKIAQDINDWHWRYTYAHADVQENIAKPLTDVLLQFAPLWPEATHIAANLDPTTKPYVYQALGVTYDNNRWWIRAEGASLGASSDLSGSNLYYYASAGRRFDEVTLYGLLGRARPKYDLPDYQAPQGYPSPVAEQLVALAETANAVAVSGRQDQSSYGVGLRWDFRPKMAVKLQAERYHVAQQGAALWLRSGAAPLQDDHDVNVVSFSLDLLF